MIVGGLGHAGSIGAGDRIEDDGDRFFHILGHVVGCLQGWGAGGHNQIHPFIHKLLGNGGQGRDVTFGIAIDDGQIFALNIAAFGHRIQKSGLNRLQSRMADDFHHADGHLSVGHRFFFSRCFFFGCRFFGRFFRGLLFGHCFLRSWFFRGLFLGGGCLLSSGFFFGGRGGGLRASAGEEQQTQHGQQQAKLHSFHRFLLL